MSEREMSLKICSMCLEKKDKRNFFWNCKNHKICADCNLLRSSLCVHCKNIKSNGDFFRNSRKNVTCNQCHEFIEKNMKKTFDQAFNILDNFNRSNSYEGDTNGDTGS